MLPELTPITRLTVATINLNTGATFQIVHDLSEQTWTGFFNRWLRKTKRPTAGNLIDFIKARREFCICVTKEQYDKITYNKAVPATEQEWLAQNQ